MKLSELIESIETIKIKGSLDIEIENVKTDSNSVSNGSLFICISGQGYDGHSFIKQAENYGAVAIVCERETETSLPQIIVKNSRKAMSIIASKFYGDVAKNMKIIGVIGTNGKTTTSHLIYNVLKKTGKKCGLIGTLGVYFNDKFIEPTLTTPDPLELHKILSKMKSDGVDIVIMEVSAHALYFDKVEGIQFEVGIFTNFTRDHLDFFKDMESYKKAKLSFFKNNKVRFIVTNSDDSVGREILNFNDKAISYGIENPSDVFAIDIKEKSNGLSFVLNLFDIVYKVNLRLIGKFNVYNALAAGTACALLGVNSEEVVFGLQTVAGVSGRLENVHSDKFDVFVDYAHTPDGLIKSINALRPVCKGKLICVFGCGGNRDVGKRAEMGRISGNLADFTVITSDNPRYEEPMEIIFEIEKGILEKSKRYVIIQDRVQAIKYALEIACLGDVILIAGKGCEKYQEILGIKHLYNDKDTVNEIMRRKK